MNLSRRSFLKMGASTLLALLARKHGAALLPEPERSGAITVARERGIVRPVWRGFSRVPAWVDNGQWIDCGIYERVCFILQVGEIAHGTTFDMKVQAIGDNGDVIDVPHKHISTLTYADEDAMCIIEMGRSECEGKGFRATVNILGTPIDYALFAQPLVSRQPRGKDTFIGLYTPPVDMLISECRQPDEFRIV